jgi:hypothetical protein
MPILQENRPENGSPTRGREGDEKNAAQSYFSPGRKMD